MPIIDNSLKKNGWVRATTGAMVPTKDLPVAAFQDIKVGDLVKFDGDGLIVQALALPGSNDSATQSDGVVVVGRAASALTTGVSPSEATDRIQVEIFSEDTEWVAPLYHSTSGNAENQDIDRGDALNFARFRGASASIWFYCIATASPTDGELTYTEPISAGDVDYGLVAAKVKAAYRAL